MILAHLKENHSGETLEEHSKLTYKYAEPYIYQIEKIIRKTFLSNKDANFIFDAAKDSILMHDEGKKSPFFQYMVMNNHEYKKYNYSDSKHSILSSIAYIKKWTEKLLSLNDKGYIEDPCKCQMMIWYFAFIISRHHSSLKNFEYRNEDGTGFRDNIDFYLKEDCDAYFINMGFKVKDVKEILDIEPEFKTITDNINIYVLCKFLYSTICYCDFMATTEYMNGKRNDDKPSFDDILKKYKDSNTGKLPYKKPTSKLNELRSEIFFNSEKSFFENISRNIYYLSAPCGAGKTNTLVNLMINDAITENRNIGVFVFPLNTLIDQTGSIFNSFLTFGKDYMIKNSITSITRDNDENTDYNNIWLKYQFIDYPLLITSHISLFNILFGTEKSNCMCLCKLVNSIVCIDEIQQYPSNVWNEMIEMFDKYSDLLGIKFILSSATLPSLGKLLKTDKCFNLLDKNYANCPAFKDRVSFNYDLLNSKSPRDDIKNIIEENLGKSILIEFIKKKTAVDFYNEINNMFENVYLITGDISKKKRNEIIKKTKEEKMILVATNVIEAGCDVDFEIGIKDISMLESDEQFSGRIARHGQYKGMIFFFNLDSNSFYRDNRTSYNLLDDDIRKYFEEKEFNKYYEKILNEIKEDKEKNTKDSILSFKQKCDKLKFSDVDDKMKLIKNNTITIFIKHNDDDSEKILEEYKQIFSVDMPFAERSIKKLNIREKMNEYLLNIDPKTFCENYKEIDNIKGIRVVVPYEESIFL